MGWPRGTSADTSAAVLAHPVASRVGKQILRSSDMSIYYC